MKLWEIIVPTRMEGVKIALEHHQEWDAKVSKISGGLMLGKKIKGKWRNQDERVLSVRIACQDHEIRNIAEMTAEHYQQDAVLYYVISPEAYIA